MAVPILKLDLAPPSTVWRLNHALIGWAAVAAGGLILAGSLGLTAQAYLKASRAGRMAIARGVQTRRVEDTQQKVLDELRAVDVTKELPRWRLAERIYTERSLPWSRLTAELERSLVQDVRVKSLQRTRGSDLKVQLKLKGEARSREAEAEFVESLQKNPFFEQVILEREGERQGGGVDFEYTLAAFSVPPPYHELPKHGPVPKARPAAAKPAAPAPAAARPVMPRPATPAPQAAPAPVQPTVPPLYAPPPSRQPGVMGRPVRPGAGDDPQLRPPLQPGFPRPPRARRTPSQGGEE